MVEKIMSLVKHFDEVYILGHNNLDADSYFSSYILSNILKKLNIKAYFTILDNFKISDENKDIINDYLDEQPMILSKEDIYDKYFILVDHNDIEQSINNDKCKVLFSIDHHIDTKKVKYCFSEEYTSTLLYIYDLFKNTYNFNKKEKELIALSVMTDSEFLVSSRFKESDKILYDELNVNMNCELLRKKYFKTTDFKQNIEYNIKTNHKVYNLLNKNINRCIIKAYKDESIYKKEYIEKLDEIYINSLLIWCEYDTKKTYVYYKKNKIREYNYILTSTVLILKDIFETNE